MALFYNKTVPVGLRTQNQEGVEGFVEKMISIVDSSVQVQLNAMLADESLLKELTEMENPSQLSHQTTYLKNRLHKQLGLKHAVSFDMHTGVILDALLDKSTQDLLDPILKRCTPEYFIETQTKDWNAMLENDQTPLDPIFHFVQSKFPDTSSDELFTSKEIKKEDYQSILKDIRSKYPDTESDIVLEELEAKNIDQLEVLFSQVQRKFRGVKNDSAVEKFNEQMNNYILTEEGMKKLLLSTGYLQNV